MDITSANVNVTLTIPLIFPNPVTLQGWSTDDAFDIDAIEESEIMMGVDGLLSAGKVYVPTIQTFSLMADSPSNSVFDAWHNYQDTTSSIAPASAVIKIPSLGIKYNIAKGVLRTFKNIADARRVMQARRHTVAWERPVQAPIAGV